MLWLKPVFFKGHSDLLIWGDQKPYFQVLNLSSCEYSAKSCLIILLSW